MYCTAKEVARGRAAGVRGERQHVLGLSTRQAQPLLPQLGPVIALLTVLRNDLGLTGPRFGCGLGVCGACFVTIDGTVVASGLTGDLATPSLFGGGEIHAQLAPKAANANPATPPAATFLARSTRSSGSLKRRALLTNRTPPRDAYRPTRVTAITSITCWARHACRVAT